jgi:hypothetical protein
MSVGVAHVRLHSGDQSIAYQTDDAEEEAKSHASGGEDEGREQHARGGTYRS